MVKFPTGNLSNNTSVLYIIIVMMPDGGVAWNPKLTEIWEWMPKVANAVLHVC